MSRSPEDAFRPARGWEASLIDSLSGAIDDQGRLELSGFQSYAMAVLSASDGSGEGQWETRTLMCHGTFRVWSSMGSTWVRWSCRPCKLDPTTGNRHRI